MKENGWVCETLEEFKEHLPVPNALKNSTPDKVESWYESMWEDCKDEIVHYNASAFPFMDIRYLEFYSTLQNTSPFMEDNGFNPCRCDAEMRQVIASLPDSVFEKIQEMDDYYDDRYQYKFTID